MLLSPVTFRRKRLKSLPAIVCALVWLNWEGEEARCRGSQSNEIVSKGACSPLAPLSSILFIKK